VNDSPIIVQIVHSVGDLLRPKKTGKKIAQENVPSQKLVLSDMLFLEQLKQSTFLAKFHYDTGVDVF
jgi:hypothetical protein